MFSMPSLFLYCLIIHFSLPGAKSDGSSIHGINAVAATQGEIDFFQRGPTPGEYWGLTEQVVILSRHLANTCLPIPSIPN
jgi:hypothetical protein